MVVVLTALVAMGATATSAFGASNKLKFVRDANSQFDAFTCANCSTAAEKQWMHDHYWRMRGYSPWYDSAQGSASAVNWAPPSYVYKSVYSIYRESITGEAGKWMIRQHPSWVLRDRRGGRPLYIPFACEDSAPGCPAYAADFGNKDFRAWWINKLRDVMRRGYAGAYLDNVNMDWRVSNGSGDFVKPFDRRTGRPMKLADWRKYMARFMEQIRNALPSKEIAHNGLWYVPKTDPWVQREVGAANVLGLERGFNDGGLTGGEGGPINQKFAYTRLQALVDWAHRRGKSVILEPHLKNPAMAGGAASLGIMKARREHEIAAYYLVKARQDSIAADFQSDPPRQGAGNGWSGVWDTDLGSPLGARYMWNGVMRRNFERGFVLVNKPEKPRRTIALGGSFRRFDGSLVTSVTLRRTPLPWRDGALSPAEEETSQGAVLFRP